MPCATSQAPRLARIKTDVFSDPSPATMPTDRKGSRREAIVFRPERVELPSHLDCVLSLSHDADTPIGSSASIHPEVPSATRKMSPARR